MIYTTIDDWGYGFIDARNLKTFFRKLKYKATDEDCVALIRRLDLDCDSKLSKEEFLEGIKSQEPYSKMIVREQMAKKEEIMRAKKLNKADQAKGKRVNKKAEEGVKEGDQALRNIALDKSYPQVLSTSPLKNRVPIDLYGEQEALNSPQRH